VKEAQLSIPDSIQPVLACRVWRVMRGSLWSLYKPIVWPRSVPLTAHCLAEKEMTQVVTRLFGRRTRHRPRQVPDLQCTCGIWALTDPELVTPHLRQFENLSIPIGVVTGLVFLWGRVVRGTNGYRGQIARVAALMRPEQPNFDADEMAESYGVYAIDSWPAEVVRSV
jgi:hypothetical protein